MENLLQTLIEQDFGYSGKGRWGHSAKHDSLVIDNEKRVWYWNSRGLSGSLKDYLIKVRGYSVKDAEDFIKSSIKIANPVLKKHKITVTPYEELEETFWRNGKTKREYWYKRLLTDDTVDRYRLGYYDGWNTVPLREDGIFLNFQIRRDDPKRIKYYYENYTFSPVLINAEILKFVTEYVYITEGIIDAILLNQLGYPAVAQTGGNYYWNPEWNYLFGKIKDIIYIRDNDRAGIIHSKIVANNLGQSKVRIVSLGIGEHYDTINFFQDGNSKDKFDDICANHFKYSFQLLDGNTNGKN